VDTITFKSVSENDEKALFALYSVVRSDELEMQSWDPALRTQILWFQFEAQTRAYRLQFPEADRQLILRDGSTVGWLLVDRSGSALQGIDIALVAEERSQGVGTRVIKALQDEAAEEQKPFVITVQRTNDRAAALYFRLGFRVVEETEVHRLMEWRGDTAPSQDRP
jgi:ribosomal protein S18 acetylase RimI-like enzyme